MSTPKTAERDLRGFPPLVRDLGGLKIKTAKELSNGLAIFPVGKLAVIDRATSWNNIYLTSLPCECCGVRLRMSRVSWRDIEAVK